MASGARWRCPVRESVSIEEEVSELGNDELRRLLAGLDGDEDVDGRSVTRVVRGTGAWCG